MKPKILYIPCQAGVLEEVLASSGNIEHISILTCDGVVVLSGDGMENMPVEMGTEIEFKGDARPKGRIFIQSGTEQTIKISIGGEGSKVTGQRNDIQLNVGTVQQLNAAPDKNETPDHITIASGNTEQIFVADPDAAKVTFARVDEESQTVFIGGPATSATKGIPLRELGVGEAACSAPLYCHNVGPSPVIIATYIEKR
jgi:hypothetical protein